MDRKSLLVGTALASTLAFGCVFACRRLRQLSQRGSIRRYAAERAFVRARPERDPGFPKLARRDQYRGQDRYRLPLRLVQGGAFIEPLATLAVNWVDIDGFSLGGNSVSFDDDASVGSRLGLRVGASYQAWTGTTIEPFVIGQVEHASSSKATSTTRGARSLRVGGKAGMH
jgi:Autotransporter beta-domain